MTTPADGLPSNYRFADLTLDVARRCVTRQGKPIELKALDFDLLRFLVEQAPNVVNADVLAEKVWGRHFVSPENVAQRVMLLRQSLADDANKPRYIETIRNRGYRLIPVVERADAFSPGAAARRRLPLAALAASLLVGVGTAVATAYWLAGSAEQPPPSPTSIAVLPFENRSPNPDDADFAAGMQDEIVSQLTKLSGFRVIAVRPGTGAPGSITDIVRGLNVATTLSGDVYYSEGRLRIAARLTEAASGASSWAHTYERERRDIFAIQSEIALEVARALSVELSLAERTRVERAPTTNTQALDYYLNAKRRHDRVSREEMRLALAELEQALRVDPKFTDAWALSSVIHTSAQFLDPERIDEHRVAARHSAEQALALDPELAAAHVALAGSLLTAKDWVGAESAFAEAMRLSRSIEVVGNYTFLRMSAGKFEAFARDAFEQARAADHQAEAPHRFLAFVYAHMGDWDRANAVYEAGLRLFASDDRAVRALQEQRMHWLVARGDLAEAGVATIKDAFNAQMVAMLNAPRAEALATLGRAFETSADGNPNHRRDIALWAGHFGDPQLALTAMREVVNAQPAQMVYVWMPQLAPMRGLPEFRAYMREIGMVAYWQEYGWPDFCRQLDEQDLECH